MKKFKLLCVALGLIGILGFSQKAQAEERIDSTANLFSLERSTPLVKEVTLAYGESTEISAFVISEQFYFSKLLLKVQPQSNE